MTKNKFKLSPTMTFILLTGITIIVSGILAFFNLQAEYQTVNTVTGGFDSNVVSVTSLFSLAGLKFIVTNAVSGFVSFAPLSMLIITLIGIGVMEKTGFTKTFFTLITQHFGKNTITFWLILISMFFPIVGDLGYVVMLPIGALLFKYGKRNPFGGIIATFAAMSFGYGVNIFMSVADSSLLSITLNSANVLDAKYAINTFFSVGIMTTALILMTIIMTYITEKVIMPKLPKFQSEQKEPEEEKEETQISKKELRGLIVSITAGVIYLLIVIYMIIPGLPFSGALLESSGNYYIERLFGEDSLFNEGFVFIVTMLFVILGFFYGIVVKNIRTNKDVTDGFSYSLDKIGNILVLIFFASLFISVFKKTEIGSVLTALFSNMLSNLEIGGLPLVLTLFVGALLLNLFYPSPTLKWAMIGVSVPVFINASLSPEYAQIVYTAGSSVTNGITPLLAYFVIYIAYLEKYNTSDKVVTLFGSIRYMLPYSFIVLAIWFILIVGWYITGVPLGVDALPGVEYVA